MAGPIQWTSPAGRDVILPQGSEFVRGSLMSWIYYNPYLNRTYHISGSKARGFTVIEYPYPLCSKCWERYRRYQQHGT